MSYDPYSQLEAFEKHHGDQQHLINEYCRLSVLPWEASTEEVVERDGTKRVLKRGALINRAKGLLVMHDKLIYQLMGWQFGYKEGLKAHQEDTLWSP